MEPAALRDMLGQMGVEEAALMTRRVLVVDDEAPNRAVLAALLDDDYDVVEAGSGAEAVELASQGRFDVLLVDQRMPGMTGVEAVEHIRPHQPDAAVLVISAYVDSPALIDAINRARAFRFVRKPWNPDELRETVRQAYEYVFRSRALWHLLGLLDERGKRLATALDELRRTQERMLHMERLSTVGQLAAGLVHDMRNAMVGLTYLESEATAKGWPDDVVETINVGLAGIRGMVSTLDVLRHFGKRDAAGALSVHAEALDVGELVDAARAVLRFTPDVKHVELDVDIADDAITVRGERVKLVQCLVNLLKNAGQAMEGQGRVLVAARRHGDQVVVSVDDTGPGIAPEVRERLFDAFASTKSLEGTGLGLYVSRLIARAHGGDLRVGNPVLGGARFELILPAG